MQSFSKSTLGRLGHYVYALVDPRSNAIFYVGKASSTDRAFNHLKSKKSERSKAARIHEILAIGATPTVEVLRFGLPTSVAAHEVESAVIDAIGLENLTNVIRGHGTDRGRLSAQEAERLLGSAPIDVERVRERCMLFFLNKSYSPTLSDQALYDSARQFWYRVAADTRTPASDGSGLPVRTALAVVDSVVVRTYTIEAWFPAGTTFSSRKWTGSEEDQRWEFVGNQHEKHRLLGKRLERHGQPLAANELGYGYIGPRREA